MALLVGSGHGLGGLAGGNATARLLVVVSGDTTQLAGAMARGAGSIQSFAQSATAIGGALTRTVTLPLLGIGAASIAMAGQYESAIARVRGLTPLMGKEVEQASDRILELATTLPTAPTELANSLYFAGSAGLAFGDAMQVVELSAKGAAVGMGAAEDISKVLIFALNTFGDSGLTAAEAMDTLTAAVKEGTAEPADLAVALGRLIPIADAAGVSFGEVTAAVASLTNIGMPTRVATTSLRALFIELLAPTQQARENLDALSISSQDLRDALAAGPLVALELLMEATDGNIDRLKAIAPQIRGLTALLGLTDNQMKAYRGTLEATKNSHGALDRAMEELSKTRFFQFQVGLNQMRVAAIEFGQTLFPVFTGIIEVISGVGRTFQNLPGWAKSLAAAFLLVGAAAGPLIRVFGALTDNGQGMFSSFRSTTAALGTMTVAALAAVAGFGGLANGTGGIMNLFLTFAGTAAAAALAVRGLHAAVNAGAIGVSNFAYSFLNVTKNAGLWGIAAGVVVTGIAAIVGAAGEGRRALEAFGEALNQGVGSGSTFRQVAIDMEATSISAIRLKDQMLQLASGPLGNLSIEEALPGVISKLNQASAAAREMWEASTAGVPEHARGSFEDPYQDLRKIIQGVQTSIEDRNTLALQGFATEQGALEDLAQRWGITTEQVAAAAAEQQVSTAGLTEAQKQMFGENAGFIEKTTGENIAAIEAQAEAERNLVLDRQKNLAGNLLGDFFEKDLQKVEASTAQLVANLQKQTNATVQFAGNVRTLLARGLDPSVLQFLVDQGPAMVGKFVNASARELKILEANYYASLGAIDAAILNEGDHEAVKGRQNIQKFAQGMLSSKQYTVAAATQIVGEVTAAVAQGKMSEAGAAQVLEYAKKIGSMQGIPKGAAARIVNSFIDGLKSGKFDNAGAEQITKYARGVAKNAGLPQKKAQDIALAVKNSLDIVGEAGALGGATGYGFAQQLGAQALSAYNAGHAVGSAAKRGMQDGLKGSPKYFTYYLGQDLMGQFDEGLNKGATRHNIGRTVGLRGRVVGPGNGGRAVAVNVDARGAIFTREQHYREFAGQIAGHVATVIRHKQSRTTRSLTGEPA